ncbi:MAG: YraN family protein [Candidatus Moranbacteria bacterium]|nr:YraN family protein [Candidatus Moranbacteria bacterium]
MEFHKIGENGERVAEKYLKSKGYKILDKNYFNQKGYRIGELDLIAEDRDGTIVFCEVKSRKGKKGEIVPGENLTFSKFKKLTKTANYFLAKNNLLEKNWRLDLVEVYFDEEGQTEEIKHIEAIYF